jgi:hypothetical protein
MSQHRESIPPIPVAFLLCDQVITDEATKKKTLVGVFDRVWATRFPTEHRPVALYARLYDAEGEHEVRVEYVKVGEEKVLAEAKGTLRVHDRKRPVEFVITLPAIPIPEPGKYEFRLWVSGRYVQRVIFTAEPHPGTSRPA